MKRVAVACLGSGFLAFSLHADVIQVTTTEDEFNVDGDCSLREAIEAANADDAIDACTPGAGPDDIQLLAGTYAMSLAGRDEDANLTGDFDLMGDLRLIGIGPDAVTIDAAQLDRVIHVQPGATVVIEGVTLSGGRPDSNSGGVRNEGNLTLSRVRVFGNVGLRFGGGIENIGELTVLESSIENNLLEEINGSGGGGGIFNSGSMTLNGVTVTGNLGGRGGGIYNLFDDALIINSTISNNDGLNGGGIFDIGDLRIAYSTIADNVARDVGGGLWDFGGGAARVTRSIFARNVAASVANDCEGPVTSLGYNLVEDVGGCSFTSQPTDLVNLDSGLDGLGNNGGPTQTHNLEPQSDAIDLIPPADCILDADQRGFARPSGTGCDAGAVESQVE